MIDFYGSRKEKYLALESYDPASEKFIEINPVGNFYLFSEFNANDWEEYSSWPSITEIFPLHSAGITSARDAFSIDFNQENLYNRISDFITMKPELAREKYSLGKDVMDWKVALAQEDVKSKGISRKYIQKIQYRIWDWRYGYYTGTTRGIM